MSISCETSELLLGNNLRGIWSSSKVTRLVLSLQEMSPSLVLILSVLLRDNSGQFLWYINDLIEESTEQTLIKKRPSPSQEMFYTHDQRSRASCPKVPSSDWALPFLAPFFSGFLTSESSFHRRRKCREQVFLFTAGIRYRRLRPFI